MHRSPPHGSIVTVEAGILTPRHFAAGLVPWVFRHGGSRAFLQPIQYTSHFGATCKTLSDSGWRKTAEVSADLGVRQLTQF